jgi:hypothetical protein
MKLRLLSSGLLGIQIAKYDKQDQQGKASMYIIFRHTQRVVTFTGYRCVPRNANLK